MLSSRGGELNVEKLSQALKRINSKNEISLIKQSITWILNVQHRNNQVKCKINQLNYSCIHSNTSQKYAHTKIREREQEHQELYRFTLSQELHPVSLPTSKEIHWRTHISIKNNTVHLPIVRTHCTLQKKHLLTLQRLQKQCRILLHHYKRKPYTICSLHNHKYKRKSKPKSILHNTI